MGQQLALLTIPAVADTLGCGRTHVYGLIASGDLRAVDIAAKGRSKTRVRADDLDAYIERQTRQTRHQTRVAS